MTRPIYLDYNGTTPHAPEVIEAMRPYFETEFGNPSSSHWYGIKPKEAIEEARDQVAELLNCRAREIVFTSGGTESNNYAIRGTAKFLSERGNHIITSSIEHPAVLEVCRYLETVGYDVSYLRVDANSRVNPLDVENAILPETILITIMHSNNEVGTLQEIAEISDVARKYKVALHSDGAQSVGKVVTDVQQLGVDLFSIAGHKLYAPKGVGALYIKPPLIPGKFCFGASQEMGFRAGTENVMEIVGLGKACEIAQRDLKCSIQSIKFLRDRLHQGIRSELKDIRLNGHLKKRLPNTLSISFKGLEANRILDKIGGEVAVSAGAACHSDTIHVSHVLEEMGVPLEWSKGTIRFSLGRMTTEGEIDKVIEVVVGAVKDLRGLSSL